MPHVSGSDDERRDPAAGGARDRLRAVAVAIALTVVAISLSLVAGVAVAVPIFLLEVDVASTPAFVSLTVASQLGFLIVAYLYARRRGLVVRISRPDRRDLKHVAGGTVVALAAITALAAVLDAFDLVPESVIEEIVAANPDVLVALAVLSVIIVAPVEEFLFRGVVQGRLRESFGPAGAIAGASLLFGSVHLANYTGSLDSVIAGALLIATTGAVLGVLYERTLNLTVPILVHAIYNVVLLGISALYP